MIGDTKFFKKFLFLVTNFLGCWITLNLRKIDNYFIKLIFKRDLALFIIHFSSMIKIEKNEHMSEGS